MVAVAAAALGGVLPGLPGLATNPAGAAPAVPPAIHASTTYLTFGPQQVGTTSAPTTLRIVNRGPGDATGLQVFPTSNPVFSVATSTCGTTLAAGATCELGVTYTPDDGGPDTGTLSVQVDGGGSVRSLLSGAPDLPTFPLGVTATSLDLGPVAVGSSATQQARILNPGTDPVSFTVTAPAPAAPFSKPATTCTGSPVTLAAGASCTISYRFAPTALGPRQASTSITVAVDGGPTRAFPVDLVGHGGTLGADPIQVSPRRLDFGPVPIGATSAPQTITVSNRSDTAMKGTMYLPDSGPDEHLTWNCKLPLAAGASCTITVTFQPLAPGLRASEAPLNYQWQAGGTYANRIRLSGFGTGEGGRLVLDRSGTVVGSAGGVGPGVSDAFTVANTGTAAITDLDLVLLGTLPDSVTEDDDCGTTLAPGATCTVTFTGDYGSATYFRFATYEARGAGQAVRFSAEVGKFPGVNLSFVYQVYRELLGSFTVNTSLADDLDAGTTTRAAVARSLFGSPAWARYVVDELARKALDRISYKGAQALAAKVASGELTVTDVAAQLYSSSTAVEVSGGTNARWLARMYVVLLHRGIDPAGLDYWRAKIGERGRSWVVRAMYDSPEGRRERVRTQYRLLQRPVDPSGLAFWAERLKGRDDRELTVQLVSSVEYLRLAQYVSRVIS
jgi:hypothetical protein